LLISLLVTTISEAFLHKGNVWAHDQLSVYEATHEKSRLHKRATHSPALNSPKAKAYRTDLSLTM